ncbi:hypothetical protein VTI74DRAFT_1159 [Chaetomium olivicolor]
MESSSSRAPAPPPLKIGPVRAPATSPIEGTSKSPDSVASGPFSSDYYDSPTSSSTMTPLTWGRKVSSGSTASTEGGNHESSHAKRPPIAQRKVNANSYCGRHSDEFLFGGKGLGDLWRAVTRK